MLLETAPQSVRKAVDATHKGERPKAPEQKKPDQGPRQRLRTFAAIDHAIAVDAARKPSATARLLGDPEPDRASKIADRDRYQSGRNRTDYYGKGT